MDSGYQHSSTFGNSAHHLLLITLPAGVNIEQYGDDDQDQAFHEDEEARDECSIFVMGVLVRDQRSQSNARCQPDKLTLSIPHSYQTFAMTKAGARDVS